MAIVLNGVKLPVVTIRCSNSDINDMVDLIEDLKKKWDFKTRYSITHDHCDINLYEMEKRKDTENVS